MPIDRCHAISPTGGVPRSTSGMVHATANWATTRLATIQWSAREIALYLLAALPQILFANKLEHVKAFRAFFEIAMVTRPRTLCRRY